MAQTSIKIGITEQGDAGIDLSWAKKLMNVAGAVLITKNITEDFINYNWYLNNTNYKTIIHCTCTGFGGTELEPNVPEYQDQLNQLKRLIDGGFPIERCVLRIDPIIPTQKGLLKVHEVMTYAAMLGFFDEIKYGSKMRVRISIMDEYDHVKKRFNKKGWPTVYGINFQASNEQLIAVINQLSQYGLTYEICAETKLYALSRSIPSYAQPFANMLEVLGCISLKDLNIMNLAAYHISATNPQNRNGCHCLPGKTELLSNKKQCPNGCEYCYWRS